MKKTLLALTLATAATYADLSPDLEIEHDHRIGFAPSFDHLGASIAYEHIKPDSIYFSAATNFNKYGCLSALSSGYNFALSDRDKLTPSVGLGILKVKHFSNLNFFTILNLEYTHRINNNFSIGATAGSLVQDNFNFTFGVPFTFHFGKERDWEIRLIPMFTHNDGVYANRDKISLGYSTGYRF